MIFGRFGVEEASCHSPENSCAKKINTNTSVWWQHPSCSKIVNGFIPPLQGLPWFWAKTIRDWCAQAHVCGARYVEHVFKPFLAVLRRNCRPTLSFSMDNLSPKCEWAQGLKGFNGLSVAVISLPVVWCRAGGATERHAVLLSLFGEWPA